MDHEKATRRVTDHVSEKGHRFSLDPGKEVPRGRQQPTSKLRWEERENLKKAEVRLLDGGTILTPTAGKVKKNESLTNGGPREEEKGTRNVTLKNRNKAYRRILRARRFRSGTKRVKVRRGTAYKNWAARPPGDSRHASTLIGKELHGESP